MRVNPLGVGRRAGRLPGATIVAHWKENAGALGWNLEEEISLLHEAGS